MTQVNSENLLTLSEVCQLLRISERTARRWVADGSLPSVKLHGQRIRVREHEARRLLEDDPRAGTPPDEAA
jgi:excisionase family DNA binding protein